jgi:hypothetical protein
MELGKRTLPQVRLASFDGERNDTLPFLVLGGAPPLVPNLDFDTRIGGPHAGIVLLGPVDPSELAGALDAAPDTAIPIADFGGNYHTRADFVADQFDSASTAALRRHFAPILHRLNALPFRCTHEDRAELTILRLAYSRDTAIEAAFDAAFQNLVEYPLLGHAALNRQRLEALAALGLLRRQHFTRTHQCSRCESARLHVVEVCPGCGSSELAEQPIVHHYHCGWQEPEQRFIKGRMLICPKCRRELRHYGVDYDKPGSVLVCRGCHKASSEPVIQFVCLDCHNTTPTAQAKSVDWYRYELTIDGLQSLREGRIPHLSIGGRLEEHPRAFTPREFLLLANEGIRVARRYDRPFAVGRFRCVNGGALRRDHGVAVCDDALSRAVDVIVESLRESDFIAIENANSFLIGMPETTKRDALHTLERLAQQIRTSNTLPVEMITSAADGQQVAEFLALEPVE